MADDYFTIALEPVDGDATARVRLAGSFDIVAREDLCDALLGLAGPDAGARRIAVDLHDVTFIDSEAINALIQGYLAADRAGIDFRLANARGIVDRVLRIVGLDHLLQPPGRIAG
ncbi:STAS domain-containing protein [Actinoplanes sp. NPDC023801]|uniref:STAS domain-containing protein n=1 Tax=Actinoplanes sp. NPDC023801 TaxID=3154595 RepID=UPI0033D43DD4